MRDMHVYRLMLDLDVCVEISMPRLRCITKKEIEQIIGFLHVVGLSDNEVQFELNKIEEQNGK